MHTLMFSQICGCILSAGEMCINTHMQMHTFVLRWKMLFTLEKENTAGWLWTLSSVVHGCCLQLCTWLLMLHMKPLTHMHTAKLMWPGVTFSVIAASVKRRECWCQTFILDGVLCLYVFYSCLHCLGVSQFALCVHNKGSRMLKKSNYICCLASFLHGST